MVTLWDTSSSPVSRPRVSFDGRVCDLAFHPSGRWLGVALNGGQIKFLPVPFPGRTSQIQDGLWAGSAGVAPLEIRIFPPTEDHHRSPSTGAEKCS